jgi:homocysteine S-methyltransferase
MASDRDPVAGTGPGRPVGGVGGEAVVVLDGGLATTLAGRGVDLSGPLWSARLLRDDPAAIVAAHRAFLTAGAEVLTTASYQLSTLGLAAVGADPGELADLQARSVALAREAVAAERSAPGGTAVRARVAASVGPYGAVLADGSEYRGGYGLTVAALRTFHVDRLTSLVAAAPDLLAVETIPSGAELAALAPLLAEAGLPAWVAVRPGEDGTTTPEGEPLLDALAPVLAVDAVVAVGVNCCDPGTATRALEVLGAATDRALVVYPNLGDRWDAAAGRWRSGTDRFDAATVARWRRAGARLIGGCCGTGPDHLRRLVALLPDGS